MKIDRIPLGNYIGYYWMSDATDPMAATTADYTLAEILNGYLENPTLNPFVIEGQLYDEDARRSVSIKYVDGRYIINQYDVTEDIDKVKAGKNDCVSHKSYKAHRMPGKRLCFLQRWRPERDPLCAGMEVLRPAEMVFVGFEPIKEKEK